MSIRLVWAPEVHLISVPMVRDEGVFEFLSGAGAPFWVSDTLSSAEELCEIAARAVELDFDPRREPPPAAGPALDHAAISVFLRGVSRGLVRGLSARPGVLVTPRSLGLARAPDLAFVVPPELAPEVRGLADARPTAADAEYRSDPMHAAFHFLRTCTHSATGFAQVQRYLEARPTALDSPRARLAAAGAVAESLLPDAVEQPALVTAGAGAWRMALDPARAADSGGEWCRLAEALRAELGPAAPALLDAIPSPC